MIRKLVIMALAMTSLPAFAGKQGVDVPNVLVVKVQIDAKGAQVQDGGIAIPLVGVQIPRNIHGDVDQAAMISTTQPLLDHSDQIGLLTTTDVSQAPTMVQDAFAKADQGDALAHLNWRWWYPYHDGGFYGYGYDPYWGLYNSNVPFYGFYYGNAVYPFGYGFYYPYGGYGYYYYY